MENKRVILVDNDEIDLVISKHVLTNNNMAHDVSLMRSGRELAQFLLTSEPAEYPYYVLLDYKMPGQTGLEVLDELKTTLSPEKISLLPYFIISSCSTDFEDLNAIKANRMVDGFIYKPLNHIRLSEILSELEK